MAVRYRTGTPVDSQDWVVKEKKGFSWCGNSGVIKMPLFLWYSPIIAVVCLA